MIDLTPHIAAAVDRALEARGLLPGQSIDAKIDAAVTQAIAQAFGLTPTADQPLVPISQIVTCPPTEPAPKRARRGEAEKTPEQLRAERAAYQRRYRAKKKAESLGQALGAPQATSASPVAAQAPAPVTSALASLAETPPASKAPVEAPTKPNGAVGASKPMIAKVDRVSLDV